MRARISSPGFLSTLATVLMSTLTLSAQTKPATPPPQQKSSMTTLSGCVDVDKTDRRTFTLSDGEMGSVYALKGVNMKDYVGQQVEITGSTASKKLVIKGGLYPSANVAAQAGDIDPAQAAMAAQAGPNANQPRPPIEFNVKSVRAIGACPPAPK